MIRSLRQQFNANFTPVNYQAFLKRVADACGVPVGFRLSETPCFFPKSLLDQMSEYGEDLIRQLDTDRYRDASLVSIPPEFKVPRESAHPMFIQVDFGLVRDESGALLPKLVELQGFPSLYAYQAVLSRSYLESFELDQGLNYFLGGLNEQSYRGLLGRAIVADQDPDQVVLMEIDPLHQKTLPDFLLTEKLLGIHTVAVTEIKKAGRKLYYEREGRRIPIRRIYNRAIVDELVRRDVKPAFHFSDDLDVEWAGHPNWYFRMSKFSLPYLRHQCVPQSWFLDRLEKAPDDLDRYILKPLFSFAGAGVNLNPTKADLAAIPAEKQSQYILQEKMNFEPVIETPFGGTKAEIRIMYIWVEKLVPVMTIIRMGRGSMMGVDHNRDLEWVGASAGLYPSTGP